MASGRWPALILARTLIALIAAALYLVPAVALAEPGPAVTGLAIDGDPTDPITQGASGLHLAPDITLTPGDPSADRSTVELTSDVDGWSLWFRAPMGAALALGKQNAVPWEVPYASGLVVTGLGRTCSISGGQFDVRELTWDAAGNVQTFAVDFAQWCNGADGGLAGSIRYGSAIPFAIATTDVRDLDLGDTTLGSPGETHTVTISSVGTGPVAFGAAIVEGNQSDEVEVVDDDCDGVTLAAGDDCTVKVRLSGTSGGWQVRPFLTVPDDTPRGSRRVDLLGTTYVPTTTVIELDPELHYWPGQTVMRAIVEPAPMGGMVEFTANDPVLGPITSAGSLEYSPGVAITGQVWPRGTRTWTASFPGHREHLPSTSVPTVQQTGLQTTVELQVLDEPTDLGSPIRLRATVTAAQGLGVPPGTITIKDEAGSTVGSGAVADSQGSVLVNVTGRGLGHHRFFASYASTSDGQPASIGARAAVVTPSITQTWSTPIPVTGGTAWLSHVAASKDAVYAAGMTTGTVDGGVPEATGGTFVVRLTTAGQIQWVRELRALVGEHVFDLVATAAGTYAAGSLPWESAAKPNRVFVTKFSTSGTVEWTREYPSEQLDRARLAPMADGGVTVTYSAVTPGSAAPIGTLVRLSPTGSATWVRTIGNGLPGSTSRAVGVAADDAGITATGWYYDPSIPGIEMVVERYDLAGTSLWSRAITAPQGEVSPVGVAANLRGIWAYGLSQKPIAGTPNRWPDENPFVRRYARDGTAVATFERSAIEVTADCGRFAVVAGTGVDRVTPVYQGGAASGFTMDGTEVWRYERVGGPPAGVDLLDLQVRGSRGYLIQGIGADTSVVAIDGIPAATDCDLDLTAPVVTAPRRGFVAGSTVLTSGKLDLRLPWTGTDSGSGIARYELAQRTDSGAWTTVSTTLTAPTATRQVQAGHRYAFRVRAADKAGNLSAWATGPTVTITGLAESSSRITYSGSWTRVTGTPFLGGAARRTLTAGAKASLTFTGRSVAWIARTGPDRGKAEVYVNGTRVATVDLYSPTYRDRRVVWVGSWTTAASRKVSIKSLGTAGRPRVDLDGLFTVD